ncbi:hypothetical protein FDP41_008114 [Naegleria fowleri]|uniref:Golgi apparatus membrane protein TVP23 homolog n=1 Tax=Naegleria fowleri TaxID=5763 RepID=A0A6A5BHD3_NAEFO|nr:uncharacterized protein FDP41_008114 [Naegleria fowleri]KAF0973410.1 hypothetical protein FDP41_008114 [Naegleria fowleri]CAG4717315.1 unnamed protein product [Naegleria fowleri]
MSSYQPPSFDEPLPGESTAPLRSGDGIDNNSVMNTLINSYNQGCPCGHPVVCFFHLFFKIAALLCYLFLTIFTDNFVLVFVLVVLLLSFDFWTVKNITGRYLVALRWWNDIKQDGTSVWRFENKSDSKQIHRLDKMIFWGSMYTQPVIWILLSLVCFIRFNFQWMVVVIFALVLTCIQLYGFVKCSRIDTGSELKNFIIERGLLQSVLARLFSTDSIFNRGGGSQSNPSNV